MEQYAWILWTVLGIALIVGEVFTLGFVLLWFGIGALAAAFAAWLGFGMFVQFLVFALISVVLTLASRPIFAKYYSHGDQDAIKTGIDSLPGMIGTVTGPSAGTLQAGEVKVYGSTWTAFPEDGEPPLKAGEKVEVLRIEGASIIVRAVHELPEWRGEAYRK